MTALCHPLAPVCAWEISGRVWSSRVATGACGDATSTYNSAISDVSDALKRYSRCLSNSKRVNDRPETWHVHYAGVRVGVIVDRSGAPPRQIGGSGIAGPPVRGQYLIWVLSCFHPKWPELFFPRPALILMQVKTETPNRGYSIVSASTDD